jgi:hypothetical protein
MYVMKSFKKCALNNSLKPFLINLEIEMLANSTTARNLSKIILNYSILRNISISSKLLNNETPEQQKDQSSTNKQPETQNVENDFLKSLLEKNKKLETDLVDYKVLFEKLLIINNLFQFFFLLRIDMFEH